jgi:uncharacterized tellurite resistance protein B-like protein
MLIAQGSLPLLVAPRPLVSYAVSRRTADATRETPMPIRRLLEVLRLAGGEPPPPEHEFLVRVRRDLERLGPDRVEYLAAFAGQLARVALADSALSKDEEASIGRLLRERAHLDESDARLILDLMHHEAETLRGLQHHLLNRSVNERATAEQKLDLIDCLYAVASADGSIANVEDQEIRRVAAALMVHHKDLMAIRSRYKDRLEVMRLMREPR